LPWNSRSVDLLYATDVSVPRRLKEMLYRFPQSFLQASKMIRCVTRTQSVKAPARTSVPCLQLARDREVYERSTGDASWDMSAVHIGVL